MLRDVHVSVNRDPRLVKNLPDRTETSNLFEKEADRFLRPLLGLPMTCTYRIGMRPRAWAITFSTTVD